MQDSGAVPPSNMLPLSLILRGYIALSPSPPKPLPCIALQPTTYSYLEKTFSRRLQRASLEYGIRLLQSSHHSDPSVLLPFRLSNSYLSADIIISGIYELLSRRLDDSMDNHSSLFLSLGGAGTHFSRLDIPGFPLLNDDGWVQKAYRRHYIHPIDPENPHLTLNVQNICQVTLEQGLQGEWLDANDVEMYLRHVKGVFWDAEGRQMAAPVSLSVQDNYEVGAIALGSDIIIDQATPSMPLGGPQLIQGVKKSPFRHLFPEVVCGPAFQTTFDIIKLVEALAQNSTCIGRCPGFRRADVDTALILAREEEF